MGDDGLVGIGDAHPFFLRHSLNLVYLVAFHPAAALYQIPGINGVFQNVIDNLVSPHGIVGHGGGIGQALFYPVCRGAGYAVFVQIKHNRVFGGSLQAQLVNLLDDFSGLRVND